MTVAHPQPPGAGAGAVVDPAQVIADTEGAELGELEPVATAGGHEIAQSHTDPIGDEESSDPLLGGEDPDPEMLLPSYDPLLEKPEPVDWPSPPARATGGSPIRGTSPRSQSGPAHREVSARR